MTAGCKYKFKDFVYTQLFSGFFTIMSPQFNRDFIKPPLPILTLYVCICVMNTGIGPSFFMCVCIVVKRAYLVNHVRPLVCLSVCACISASATGWISVMFGIGDSMKIS